MSKVNIIKATGLTVAVVAGSALAVTAANAHQSGGSEQDQAARVTEFAEQFGLEESEVQTYFNEKREERQVERAQKQAEYISGLVEAGTLTQEQSNKMTLLRDEFLAEIQELKESGAERDQIRAALKENRAKFESWAESESINLDEIKPVKSKGHRGGRH